MKQIVCTSFAGLCLLVMMNVSAQEGEPQDGEVVFNPSQTVCLTAKEHERYQLKIIANKALLDAQGKRSYHSDKASQQVLFDWPIRQADGFDFASTWGISNYVDHNPATNMLQDWNCSTRTYDTASGYDHSGVDIYT